MRQKKTRKLPPKGNGGENMTEAQAVQLIVKRHPKIIEYLSKR